MNFLKNLFLLGLAILLFAGCKKDEPKKVNPGPKSAFYFSAKIDGKDVLLQDGVDGFGSGAGAGSSSGGANGYVTEQSGVITNMSLSKQSGIMIYKKLPQEPTQCSEIENIFYPGVYAYSLPVSGQPDAYTDGAVIMHVDDNGVFWSSQEGTDQTGSTFQIVEHIANLDGWSKRISKATFSCKLYDGNGNMKVLTNGEFRGRTVQCGNL